MNHVMIDLETYGTKAGCVLRSIGAVFFNPEDGTFGEEFYANFTYEDQISRGAYIDPDTKIWWNSQSHFAQEQLLIDQTETFIVLSRFTTFFKNGKGKFVWSQGSNFDGVLLEHTLGLFEIKVPWRFYNTRDTRTAYQMSGLNTKIIPRQGTYHNALDDAKHQVHCVIESYKVIK